MMMMMISGEECCPFFKEREVLSVEILRESLMNEEDFIV